MTAANIAPVTADVLKRAFALSEFVEIPASIEDFWQLITLPEYHIEYINQHLVGTMSYGSLTHERIVSNMIFEMRLAFGDIDFEVFPSNRPVYAAGCREIYLPDLHIVEGTLALYHYDKTKTAHLNPSVIVEVHSKSTRDYDLTEKLACYKDMPSVKQIIYIETESTRVTSFQRTPKAGQWLNIDYIDLTQKCKILNKHVSLSKIYKNVIFEKTQ